MSQIIVTSPYDGKTLATLDVMNVEEVDKVLNRAKEAYDDQKNWLPMYKRIEILEKTIQLMNERIEELTLIAASEGGKPYSDSKAEVLRAINGIRVAIEHMGNFTGTQIPMGHTQSSQNRIAYTMKEPIGVVLAISAFNHPLNLAIHQIIPAIAVGSPVIIRPSASTPMSALNLVDILHEAGLPKAWCQAVVCSRETAEHIVKSPKIDFFAFIGSAAVGWHLNSIVAPGTRVALEHGGVAPVIVEADADIEELIPALAKGGFYHAGQVCVSVQRIYVHESIVGEVSTKLTDAANNMKVGDPLKAETEVGPLISNKEITRVSSWVKEAVNSGATLLCGGKLVGETCYAPTILLNPSKETTISKNEVFGPVVCIYTYSDIEDAFSDANSLDVSFQAAVFTKNLDTALLAVQRLSATAVMVNDHTAFRVDWMPFGGAKSSGLGMGGILHAMEEMSKEKMMVIKSSVL
jgi:acyl-CoA reductase-like NAD-dependent aldehyde dehydrogenase